MLSLSEQKDFLLNGLPVSVLTGNEFAKKDGVTLTQVVVIREYASGNRKLYVHEVSLRQKLLDGNSNPALIQATHQGVIPGSSNDCVKTTHQGNIAKVLQKIISAKK